jgi:hypothetical protein
MCCIAWLQVTAKAAHHQVQQGGTPRQLHRKNPAAAPHQGLAAQQQQQQLKQEQQKPVELPGQPDPRVEAMKSFLI